MFSMFREFFRHWFVPPEAEPIRLDSDSQLRKHVVSMARGQIGLGEDPRLGNNQGVDVVKYRRGKGGKGSWCAAFASWVLEEVYKQLRRKMPFDRSTGAKRLRKNILKAGGKDLGKTTALVLPGDLVFYHRGRRGVLSDAWKGHVAIVVKVHEDGTYDGCHGNVGKVPAKVKITQGQDPSHERIVGFVRLP